VSATLSRVNQQGFLSFVQGMIEQETALSVNLAQASDYYLNSAEDSFQRLPRRELVELLKAIVYLLPKASLHSLLKVSFLQGAIAHLEGKYTPLACSSYLSNVLVSSDLDLLNCTVRFEAWGPKPVSREAKLSLIGSLIRQPRARQRVLRQRIQSSGCEQSCHTPCESYVHTISALLDPRQAPGVLWRYLRVCVESLLLGERYLRSLPSRSPLPATESPAFRA
jgi:hypothetical protein